MERVPRVFGAGAQLSVDSSTFGSGALTAKEVRSVNRQIRNTILNGVVKETVYRVHVRTKVEIGAVFGLLKELGVFNILTIWAGAT
jgi:hypothetical protein